MQTNNDVVSNGWHPIVGDFEVLKPFQSESQARSGAQLYKSKMHYDVYNQACRKYNAGEIDDDMMQFSEKICLMSDLSEFELFRARYEMDFGADVSIDIAMIGGAPKEGESFEDFVFRSVALIKNGAVEKGGDSE